MLLRSRRPRVSRILFAATLAAFVLSPCLAILAPAVAGECSDDIANLSKKRQEIIDDLNRLAMNSPNHQLDPAVSCPKLRELAEAETQLVAYLQKNKDWCMVPDEAITNITMSLGRSKMVAGRACQIAEQIKKNQEAGGLEGGAQKLPSGPL